MKVVNFIKPLSVASLLIATAAIFYINSGSMPAKNAKSVVSVNADDNSLLGAGSSFVNPLFQKMFSEYNKKTGIQVNYQSIGSGGGVLQLTNKTVDFADSDAPLNDEQATKMGVPALHIPMCAGAVVLSYNIPGVTAALKLTPEVIGEIFLGNIKTWNDAKITALNKGISIPAMPILIAHRSDGSGTTNIFTSYLNQVSKDWASKVGKGSSVNWPVGLGGKGNEGVAGLVKQTPGTIGYIELAYAIQNKMPYAHVQNKKAKFIEPTVASTSAAGNIKDMPKDSKVAIVNTDAPDGYPIASFTWAIIYKEQKYNERSKERATKLVKLLWWNIHEGQAYCNELHYAPLPKAAVKIGEDILKSATYDGKPLM